MTNNRRAYFVERIKNLEISKQAFVDDEKELAEEIKAEGFEPHEIAAMKKIAKAEARGKTQKLRAEHDAMADLFDALLQGEE